MVGLLTLALAMAGGTALADDPPAQSPFTDVSTSDPDYREIAWMYTEGISTGWEDGTYQPDVTVDRDAMAAFFYRYRGNPPYTPPNSSPFTDIYPQIQFYKEMAWMKETGISTGWSDGTYRPWAVTNRDAMSAFLYRVADSPDYIPPSAEDNPFTDINPQIQFYKEMSWMWEMGIATVEDGTFDAWEPVTRRMMAVFMYRLANPEPLELSIITSSLPAAVVGTPYSAQLAAVGGGQSREWSASGLPAGLQLNPASGEISGTPTTTGVSNVTVSVSAAGASATAQLQLEVKAVADLAITTTSLPPGVVGTAYSAPMAATGGTSPFTWSASGLPAGLTINASTGEISGTPTTVGEPTATVRITDAEGVFAEQQLSIKVTAALRVLTNALPAGVVTVPYGANLSAEGGVAPYQWSASGLPGGLSVSANGQISGTPQSASNSTVTVRVTDAAGTQATRQLALNITVSNDCNVLKCIAITIDDGPVAYSDQLLNAFNAGNAKATFFDVGSIVRSNPAPVTRRANAGMEIGVHGWDHVDYTQFGYNYVYYDFGAAGQAIEDATGYWPRMHRPPYGFCNQTVITAARDLGFATIMWTDNTWDYEENNPTWLREDTVDLARRNGVLLMHDEWVTAQAMPGIISDLQDRGYTLVTVSQLVGQIPTAGQVYFDSFGNCS